MGATLVPDQTPLDRFLGGNSGALTATQRRGLDLFTGKAGCARCHAGPELTDASVDFSVANGLVKDRGACRVENQLAPFDHPALSLPNGGDLPALGAGGTGPCP